MSLRATILTDVHLRQFRIANDGGKDIVEIMRDATSESTDSLQLLRLPKVFLTSAQCFLSALALNTLRDEFCHGGQRIERVVCESFAGEHGHYSQKAVLDD